MLSRFLYWAIAIFGAVSASQLPEFAQQYRQRLGGAVDELRVVVERFDADARSQNMTRTQALNHHLLSRDDLFKKRGQAMNETIERYTDLTEQQQSLKDHVPLFRLMAFPAQADRAVAKATFNAYEPALPVTTEGGILAALGAYIGWLIGRLCGWPYRAIRRQLLARPDNGVRS